MNADEFGRILEDRLSGIVPPGFYVAYSDDGLLRFSSDLGRFPGQTGDYRAGQTWVHLRDNFESSDRTLEERVVNGCIHALDSLQDYIDEATHDPWPGTTKPPAPYAEVRGATVFFGYGTTEETLLACEPIPLD